MKHLRPFILSIALMTCVGMSAANFGTKADTSIVKKYQDSIALYKARYDSIKNVHVQNGYASVNSKFYQLFSPLHFYNGVTHDLFGMNSANDELHAVNATLAKILLNGSPIRQDYLETALKWIANSQSKPGQKMTIEGYMAKHQHDPNAVQLWQYFSAVITWITATYDLKKRKQIMKGVDWGKLYDRFKDELIDKAKIDQEIGKLIIDSEVQNKKGICSYVLTRDEHDLGLRAFPDDIKLEVYEAQHHHCANPDCPNKDVEFDFNEMEGDHITPWHDGGKTVIENCQMLCRDCNRRKGAK